MYRGKPADGNRPIKTLERVISKAGRGSRTEARQWIAAGRVAVNGSAVRDPEVWIDLERDRVALDGKALAKEERVYLLLYKPKGYLTTYRDPQGRPTVYDLLEGDEGYLFPVGRLDLDTSGLLIMTNDADFAERLMNPDYHVAKTYQVKASIHLDDDQLERLRLGMELDDGPTRPARVRRIRETAAGRSVIEITITEGRNRQVRRMIEAFGGVVLKLVRTAIGPVTIGDLPIGKSRLMTPNEVNALAGRRTK